MNDTESLTALMEADRWIERVRAQRDHLPESSELATIETELRTLAARLQSIEAERRPTRDAFNEAVDRAESLRQRRSDLERRLSSATAPPRELSAMQQELDHLTNALNTAEDSEVSLMLELEPLDQVADEVRTIAQPLAARRREMQEAIKELTATLDDEIMHLRESRAAAAALVASPLRARYEAALARSGISGAALLDGTRCDGCRIALSPLDLDRVRSAQEGQFIECFSCGRLLISC